MKRLRSNKILSFLILSFFIISTLNISMSSMVFAKHILTEDFERYDTGLFNYNAAVNGWEGVASFAGHTVEIDNANIGGNSTKKMKLATAAAGFTGQISKRVGSLTEKEVAVSFDIYLDGDTGTSIYCGPVHFIVNKNYFQWRNATAAVNFSNSSASVNPAVSGWNTVRFTFTKTGNTASDNYTSVKYEVKNSATNNEFVTLTPISGTGYRWTRNLTENISYAINVASKTIYIDNISVNDSFVLIDLPKVSKPIWAGSDSNIIQWEAVNNVTNYELKLHKNGNLLETKLLSPAIVSCDLTEEIEENGNGSYSVTVQAKGDGGITTNDGLTSDFSNIKLYESSLIRLDTVEKPVWASNSIAWKKVPNASHYEIKLYKNSNLQNTIVARSTDSSYDLTSEMNSGGSGNYTVTIQAKGDLMQYSNGAVSSPSDIKSFTFTEVGVLFKDTFEQTAVPPYQAGYQSGEIGGQNGWEYKDIIGMSATITNSDIPTSPYNSGNALKASAGGATPSGMLYKSFAQQTGDITFTGSIYVKGSDNISLNIMSSDAIVFELMLTQGNLRAYYDTANYWNLTNYTEGWHTFSVKLRKLNYQENYNNLVLFFDGVGYTIPDDAINNGFKSSRLSVDRFAIGIAASNSTIYLDNITVMADTVKIDPKPIASNVKISDETAGMFTGTYNYSSLVGYKEGATTFKWLRAPSAQGPFSEVAGQTGNTIPITANDFTYYFKFVVTPKDETGLAGTPAESSALKPTAKPQAVNINIVAQGNVLSGAYDYFNIGSVSEGKTTFRWLTSDTRYGKYIPLSGETQKQLALKENQMSKYFKFEVTPTAEDGIIGIAALSEPFINATESTYCIIAADAIRLEDLTNELNTGITADLTLPSAGLYDTKIAWNSSNQSVISNLGAVKRPIREKDAFVTLTASVTKDSREYKKVFSFIVKSLDPEYSFEKTPESVTLSNYETNGFEKPLSNLFTDVPKDYWAYDYIETLYSLRIINGTADGKFEPERAIKKEEISKMLVVAFNMFDKDANVEFDDVSKNDWYYAYVAVLFQNKIINGVSDKLFGAGQDLSRQDLAVMIARVCKYANIDLSPKYEQNAFADEDSISAYALPSIVELQRAGIISGNSNNEFMPLKIATRSETAKLICLLYILTNI